MDLQWLLPEQIDQILKLCELSSMEDLSVAANILESNHWNLESALEDVTKQNDYKAPTVLSKQKQQLQQKNKLISQQINYSRDHQDDLEDSMEYYYQHLDQFSSNHPQANGSNEANKMSSIPVQPEGNKNHLISQQNKEYEAMQKQHFRKKIEETQAQQQVKEKQQEIQKHFKQFQDRPAPQNPIQFKFRLPHSGQLRFFKFDRKEPIQALFHYVSGQFRDSFEHRYADFDLTQAFPQLTLKNKQSLTIREVFEDSDGELLIVKQL